MSVPLKQIHFSTHSLSASNCTHARHRESITEHTRPHARHRESITEHTSLPPATALPSGPSLCLKLAPSLSPPEARSQFMFSSKTTVLAITLSGPAVSARAHPVTAPHGSARFLSFPPSVRFIRARVNVPFTATPGPGTKPHVLGTRGERGRGVPRSLPSCLIVT